jgi:hypothetical protein
MSSNYSTIGLFSCGSKKGGCKGGNWSGMNIAAMVIGFIFFWPVGLVVLYWNISGRDVRDLPSAAQNLWVNLFGKKQSDSSRGGNSVFNEFQQTQYDRISEIKDEIKNRARSFRDYRSDAKRRADETEFENFMSSVPLKKESDK